MKHINHIYGYYIGSTSPPLQKWEVDGFENANNEEKGLSELF